MNEFKPSMVLMGCARCKGFILYCGKCGRELHLKDKIGCDRKRHICLVCLEKED